jgi:2-keto-myo-inositol isomerase
MKACLNQATLNQTDVQDFIQAASSAGFQGIEFRIEKLRSYAALNNTWSQLRELLEVHHLEAVCVGSLEEFSYVPSEDFEAVLHRAREFATVCQHTGCKILHVAPTPVQKKIQKAKAIEMTAGRLSRIAQVAAEYSVGVGFEFLAEASASTVHDAVEVLNATVASNVGLIIDTFHCHVGGSTLDELRDFPLERLWIVHFNDVEPGQPEMLTDEKRLLPGRGVIKLREYERRLKDHGWDGWLSIEMFRPEYWREDPLQVAKESFNSLKPYL